MKCENCDSEKLFTHDEGYECLNCGHADVDYLDCEESDIELNTPLNFED